MQTKKEKKRDNKNEKENIHEEETATSGHRKSTKRFLLIFESGSLWEQKNLTTTVVNILTKSFNNSLLFLFRILFVFLVSIIAPQRAIRNKSASLISCFFLSFKFRCVFFPTVFFFSSLQFIRMFPFSHHSCKHSAYPVYYMVLQNSKGYLVIGVGPTTQILPGMFTASSETHCPHSSSVLISL